MRGDASGDRGRAGRSCGGAGVAGGRGGAVRRAGLSQRTDDRCGKRRAVPRRLRRRRRRRRPQADRAAARGAGVLAGGRDRLPGHRLRARRRPAGAVRRRRLRGRADRVLPVPRCGARGPALEPGRARRHDPRRQPPVRHAGGGAVPLRRDGHPGGRPPPRPSAGYGPRRAGAGDAGQGRARREPPPGASRDPGRPRASPSRCGGEPGRAARGVGAGAGHRDAQPPLLRRVVRLVRARGPRMPLPGRRGR